MLTTHSLATTTSGLTMHSVCCVMLLVLALSSRIAASEPPAPPVPVYCPANLPVKHRIPVTPFEPVKNLTLVYTARVSDAKCSWNIEADTGFVLQGAVKWYFQLRVSNLSMTYGDRLDVYSFQPLHTQYTPVWSITDGHGAGNAYVISLPVEHYLRVQLTASKSDFPRNFNIDYAIVASNLVCESTRHKCANGATCVPRSEFVCKPDSYDCLTKTYDCMCLPGFSGQFCEFATDRCTWKAPDNSMYDLGPLTVQTLGGTAFLRVSRSENIFMSFCDRVSSKHCPGKKQSDASVCLKHFLEPSGYPLADANQPTSSAFSLTTDELGGTSLHLEMVYNGGERPSGINFTFHCEPGMLPSCMIPPPGPIPFSDSSLQSPGTDNDVIPNPDNMCLVPFESCTNTGENFWNAVLYSGVGCPLTDPCASMKCQNSGTCTVEYLDKKRVAKCACPDGYFGKMCEYHDGDLCAMTKCENGGTCYEDKWTTRSLCICGPHYSGEFCTEQNRLCPTSLDLYAPAIWGPWPTIGSQMGYNYGDRCEWILHAPVGMNTSVVAVSFQKDWVMMHGHSVQLYDHPSNILLGALSFDDPRGSHPLVVHSSVGSSVRVLLSSPDPAGADSEDMFFAGFQAVDPGQLECRVQQNPCIHGNCTRDPIFYGTVCTCEAGWTGSNCDIRDQGPCASWPCYNGGICRVEEHGVSARCDCPPTYEGSHCEYFLGCGLATSCKMCSWNSVWCQWCTADGCKVKNSTCTNGDLPVTECPAAASSSSGGLTSGETASVVIVPILVVALAVLAFFYYRGRVGGGRASKKSSAVAQHDNAAAPSVFTAPPLTGATDSKPTPVAMDYTRACI